MKKNLKSYVAIGLSVCALTVGGSFSALAATNNTDSSDLNSLNAPLQRLRGERAMAVQDFSKLVTDGIVDQATADKMSAYMEENGVGMKAEMGKMKGMAEGDNIKMSDPFTEMVAAGIITQDQADAIKAATPQRPAGMDDEDRVMGKMDFSDLVTSGMIDQATADKMFAHMEESIAGRKAEMDKMKDMTESERQAYFENVKNLKINDPFDEMVTAGIITQDQADAIKTTRTQSMPGFKNGGGMGKMNFSKLVTDGIIDQVTADKMSAHMEENTTDRKAEMDKMKDMTESERQAYFESMKDIKMEDPFAEMVTSGIITQDQADAIKAAMPQHRANGADQAAASA